MPVRTRFAPSPTGYLHVGGARTALFCLLQARRAGGEFLLRIEDTDRERSTPEAVQQILDGMAWLGLDADAPAIFQTHRFARYREVAEQLLREGKAYKCYCSKDELEAMRHAQEAAGEKPRYNGYWRDRSDPPPAGVPPVIRFKNPQTGTVIVNDRVRGKVEFANEELDDLVIWRSDDAPTYNFAVVVDDADMGISDVIRGDDHLNNTPRQINMYAAMGWPAPRFAHLPMILGPDGAKLSKRHGAVSVLQYRDEGFLPHALLNYLVRLGWSHGDQEIFSMEELQNLFSVDDVNHSASRFDIEKLRWLNAHYIKTLEPALLVPHLQFQFRQLNIDEAKGPSLVDVIVGLRERCVTLDEMAIKSRVWFAPLTHYDEAAVAKQFTSTVRAPLSLMMEKLTDCEPWNPAAIHTCIEQTGAELSLGLGKFGPALRLAMTGSTQSPALDQTIYLAGKSQALARLQAAIKMLPQ
jgi:glutamyl-tRNA synthetase